MANLYLLKALFVCICFALINISSSFSYQRVCYLKVRHDVPFDPQQINATLCTHIIVGFASVVNGTIQHDDPRDAAYWRQVVGLKQNYTHLKIMLSIGGGGNDKGFHEVCTNGITREVYIYTQLH
jgi:chitinase